jgi:hypothetical protein
MRYINFNEAAEKQMKVYALSHLFPAKGEAVIRWLLEEYNWNTKKAISHIESEVRDE